jgi:alkylation response protein AidB-like acyl-CoA dehydrogenase
MGRLNEEVASTTGRSGEITRVSTHEARAESDARSGQSTSQAETIEQLHMAADSERSRAIADDMSAWLRELATNSYSSISLKGADSIPDQIVLGLRKQGFLGMDCPESLGGRGLSLGDRLRLIKQLGAIDLRVAGLVSRHNSLGLRPVVHAHFSNTAKTTLIMDAVSGHELLGYAFVEAGGVITGSGHAGTRSVARQTEEGMWRLSGSKLSTIHAGLRCDSPIAIDSIGNFANPEAVLADRGQRSDPILDALSHMHLYRAASTLGGAKQALGIMEHHLSSGYNAGAGVDEPDVYNRLWSALLDVKALEMLIDRATDLIEATTSNFSQVCAVAGIVGAERVWCILHDSSRLIGSNRGEPEHDLLASMTLDAAVLAQDEPSGALLSFLGSSIRDGNSELVTFIQTQLADRETAAMLRESLAWWMDSSPQLSRALISHLNLGIGRVFADAVMFASGKVAAHDGTITPEMLQDRLSASIAGVDALWPDGRSLTSDSAKNLLFTVRGCIA